MTMTMTPSAVHLRDALYALSLAKHVPDAELLDEVTRLYPEHADVLTEFAIELAMDSLRGEVVIEAAESAIDTSWVSPAVARAMSRFQNRLHAVEQSMPPLETKSLPLPGAAATRNPSADLDRAEFRAFASRICANTVFVAKLRDRQIEAETMTDSFRRHVADELGAPLEVVIAHFATENTAPVGRQFFKADVKPDGDQRQSFAEAVQSSGLSEEQQRQLLSL